MNGRDNEKKNKFTSRGQNKLTRKRNICKYHLIQQGWLKERERGRKEVNTIN